MRALDYNQLLPRMSNWFRLRFVLSLFCLGMIALHAAVFWIARRQVRAGSPDFSIFYTAGLILRRNQSANLYSDELQRRTQQEFCPDAVRTRGFLPYNHPPFEAVLYPPLTHLPYLKAYSIWLVLNLLFAAATLYFISPWLPKLTAALAYLIFLVPLAFFPTAYALMQGQDSILLMCLYCLAYVALRGRRDVEAGIYLGLGLFKFHLVLPFAFVLFLRRRWRALAGIILGACFDLGLSWVIVGWKELVYYPRYVWQVDRARSLGVIVPQNMPNLRGLLTGWTGSALPPRWLEIVLVVVSICLLVWASRQWRPADPPDTGAWNIGFSIALVAAFLAGYHSYNQDMSIVLLPILISLDHTLGLQRGGVWLKLALGLLFFSPLYLVLTLLYSHQNLFALVLLGFAACLAASSSTAQVPTWAGKQ